MVENILLVSLPLLGFIIGSIPFAYLVGKIHSGVDIRELGSGNPGASNVFRTLGPVPGVFALVMDVIKGVVALWVAGFITEQAGVVLPVWSIFVVATATVAGHVFSPVLRFKGGKGVATYIGTFLMLFPIGFLAAFGIALLVIVIFKKFSLGSMIGALMLPVAYFVFVDDFFSPASLPLFIYILLAVFLILIRHLDNIRRIITGKEHGLRESAS